MTSNRSKLFSIFCMIAVAWAICPAQTPKVRYPLTPAWIAQAVTMHEVVINPAEIELPLPLTASVSSPVLEVRGTELGGLGVLRVRMRCRSSAECLPFLALLNLRDPSRVSVVNQALRSSFLAEQPIRASAAPVLHAGQRTLLLLEYPHMRISLPVISIDVGTPGAEVRVSSLDRKQTYKGIVTDDQTVRGVLP